MADFSTADEFQLLEHVQGCANNPRLWPKAINSIEVAFFCRTYLLELFSNGKCLPRYCDPDDTNRLWTSLNSLHSEDGQSALGFLLNDSKSFHPYTRNNFKRPASGNGSQLPDHLSEFEAYPGYITVFERHPDRVTLFCCTSASKSQDGWDKSLPASTFERLSRTVARTLELTDVLEQKDTEQNALLLMLQQQSSAAFLLGSDLEIMTATPPCEKLLSDGDIFSAKDNRLIPVHKDVENVLARISEQIENSFTANGTSVPEYDTTTQWEQSILLARDDDRLSRVMIRTLWPKQRTLAVNPNAYILVEVRNPMEVPEEMNNLLKSRFELSERESELAYYLAKTGSLTSTLEILYITRNTAKTHLRRIYEKTSTQSQLELTKLLHSLSGLF